MTVFFSPPKAQIQRQSAATLNCANDHADEKYFGRRSFINAKLIENCSSRKSVSASDSYRFQCFIKEEQGSFTLIVDFQWTSGRRDGAG